MDTVDAELGRLISRRASLDQTPDPDEQDERWKVSVAAHNARLREENRAAWCSHHQGQAARLRDVLEALITSHEAQAAKLEDGKE